MAVTGCSSRLLQKVACPYFFYTGHVTIAGECAVCKHFYFWLICFLTTCTEGMINRATTLKKLFMRVDDGEVVM